MGIIWGGNKTANQIGSLHSGKGQTRIEPGLALIWIDLIWYGLIRGVRTALLTQQLSGETQREREERKTLFQRVKIK